jgi:transposase
MKDHETRVAVLRLKAEGHGARAIATALGVGRNTVRRILRSGRAEVPELERPEKADGHEDRIRELFVRCKGNRVRVHEELAASGIPIGYATLTGYCRRHGIGVPPKVRVGQYHFAPGEEMQHDTSPHDVEIGGRKRRVQCASVVLCYSRRIYAQAYPTWNRFWAKVFLTQALTSFGGSAGRCMLDNASIIVAGGTGKNAVIAPEAAAFAERFGFVFEAHELGDADRSARVERPFHYIENNFYAGRVFVDLEDLNAQLAAWCEKVNATFRRHLGARPMELFAAEMTALRPLPLHVPEPYRLWHRTVDVEGYVNLHRNRYSVPAALIDRELQLHETKDRIRIYDGHRFVCEHDRDEDGAGKRTTLPAHQGETRWRYERAVREPLPEEKRLVAASPALAAMVAALKQRHGGRAARPLQRLHRMWLDYPLEPLQAAIGRALQHGLLDLDRVEALVLRHVAGDFFRLRPPERDDNEEP